MLSLAIILGITLLVLIYMAYGDNIRQIHFRRVLKRENRKMQIVGDHSTKVMRFKEMIRGLESEIYELNQQEYTFIEAINLQQYNRLIKDSKAAFKKAYSKDEINSIKSIIEQAKKNEDIAYELSSWVSSAPDTPTEDISATGLSVEEFRDIESKVINSLFPVDDPVWEIEVLYSSPGGRNHYQESVFIDLDEMKNFIKEEIEHNHETDEKKIERSKMSNSLRYDVLRRDGFRCKICGRTAEDGVTLEVDHIIPISKGGKTEANNLRTLCKDCNRGKRDKLE